jgi:hypothetical protein
MGLDSSLIQSITIHQVTNIMSLLPESNQRPTDYKSVALPAELRRLSLLKRCKIRSLLLISKEARQIFS